MFLKQKIWDLKKGYKTNGGKLLKEMDLSADSGKSHAIRVEAEHFCFLRERQGPSFEHLQTKLYP